MGARRDGPWPKPTAVRGPCVKTPRWMASRAACAASAEVCSPRSSSSNWRGSTSSEGLAPTRPREPCHGDTGLLHDVTPGGGPSSYPVTYKGSCSEILPGVAVVSDGPPPRGRAGHSDHPPRLRRGNVHHRHGARCGRGPRLTQPAPPPVMFPQLFSSPSPLPLPGPLCPGSRSGPNRHYTWGTRCTPDSPAQLTHGTTPACAGSSPLQP